jgi:hypothetical protein
VREKKRSKERKSEALLLVLAGLASYIFFLERKT